MNYHIGIVGHYAREHLIDTLTEQVKPAFVNIDEGDLGPNANHLQVWRHLAHTDTTWSVVLEDDAAPIPDFNTHLQAALNQAPAPIVSLYLGTQRPPQHQADIQAALNKADANDAHWIISNQLYHAVAVAMWTGYIPHMLAHIRPYLPIDENIGYWARSNNLPIAYTVPSLVDHHDVATLIRHPDGAERDPGRRAWRIGTHEVWNNTTVET